MRFFYLFIIAAALFWGGNVFAIDNVASDDVKEVSSEQPLDYAKINKTLDEITKTLNLTKPGRAETEEFVSTLADLQARALSAQKADTASLQAIVKKINALASGLKEGEEAIPEIAKEQGEFENEAGKYKYQLAQNALVLAKIDEINNLILKTRNKELIDGILVKQHSILEPEQFLQSILSFGNFLHELLVSPFAWYKKLAPAEQKDAQKQLGLLSFMLAAALILAVIVKSYIKKHFSYDLDVSKPTYYQKFKAGVFIFAALGIIPGAIIAAFLFWLKRFELMKEGDFFILVKDAAVYLLYFLIMRAEIIASFAPNNPDWRLFNINAARVKTATRALIFAALLIMAAAFVQQLAADMNYNADIIYSLQILANGVKAFAVSWACYKLMYDAKDLSDEDFESGNIQKLSASSQAALLIVFFMAASFLVSLFGYIRLSSFIIDRFIISIGVVGILYILNNLLRILYHTVVRMRFWTSAFRISPRTLVKSEVWFGLVLFPVTCLFGILALLAVWGVSVDILIAKTKGFLTGFNIGEVHISIASLALGVISFWVMMLLIKMLKNSIANGSLSRLDFDDGMKNSIISGVGFFGFIFSVILGIAVAGGSFQSLAIMAGALSFGAGLGLQNVVSNLVAGITILFERPIKLGDLVIINGYEGVVKQISMRSTILEMGNKSNVIIPNSAIISGSMVNKTHENRMGRIEIAVGGNYDSDIKKVKELLLKIAADDADVLSNPAPSLVFSEFADSSLNFQLNCYTANVFNNSGISFRLRENIINEFRKEGINIPFPQRVVRPISGADASTDAAEQAV